MEILQLKYFCSAAETNNFSKTAEKFLVPPSNISQTIKRLESELETPLFERQANKIRLNEAGLAFYKSAKAALDLLENAKYSLKKPQTQTIRINMHTSRRVVMESIENFRSQFPNVLFVTVDLYGVTSGEDDIIVTDKELDLPYLKTRVAEESLLLAYNKNAFDFDDCDASASLASAPFITMNIGSSIYEYTHKICGQLGFYPHIVLQSNDPFYIRKCIEAGLGVSITPEISWRGQFSENIAFKKLGNDKRNVYVYKKHDKNEYLNNFCDLLIRNFSLQASLG